MIGTVLSAEEYVEMIDHLDGYSHQIFHGDESRMDEAIRLAKQVPQLREALRAMVELWDLNHDDPCACDARAPDDITEPLPCELCVARELLAVRP